jgi:4-diphosphocytidyl-2-C-methyl-D-erythritol kinase
METIILNSISKINIGLNILRKREDGYHDLETIFYPVKLCDTISFKKSSSFRFHTSSEILKNDNSNLVIRAKDKIQNITGEKINAEITLAKYIPFGGGLGGGSSNAATTLKGLNMLYNFNLSEDILKKAALELGSDVPFFLNSVPCYATSRGEELKEIQLRFPHPILIVNPNLHVSTKWAFENIIPKVPEKSLYNLISEYTDIADLRRMINNDFEDVVFSHYPEIKKVKEDLYAYGAVFALMSGSGSTVYGIFDDIDKTLKAQSSFNKNYLTFIDYENF